MFINQLACNLPYTLFNNEISKLIYKAKLSFLFAVELIYDSMQQILNQEVIRWS